MLLNILLDCPIIKNQSCRHLCYLWALFVINFWRLFLFFQFSALRWSTFITALLTYCAFKIIRSWCIVYWSFIIAIFKKNYWFFILFLLRNPLSFRKFVLIFTFIFTECVLVWSVWHIFNNKFVSVFLLLFWCYILNYRIWS